MSEPTSSEPGYHDPGPSLPKPASNPQPKPTPPSALTYAEWAASRKLVEVEFVAKGKPFVQLAKVCPFCAEAIRCPTSDQSLIEHMKSAACKDAQEELEAGILAATNSGTSLAVPTATSRPVAAPTNAPYQFGALISALPPLCEGAELELPTSPWANYPWHLHDRSHTESARMPYTICAIKSTDETETLYLRSYSCLGVASAFLSKSCLVCAQLLDSHLVKSIVQRMENESPANGLQRRYYSHKQMGDAMDVKDRTIQRYRLKGLEVSRNAERLLGKLNDYKHLTLALSECDNAAVSRVVRVALRQGCGPNGIVDRLGKAEQGVYHSRDYRQKGLDMALLTLRLGGPRLVFALQKTHQYPSVSTVNRRTKRLYMRPSIGPPTLDEVKSNIKTICGSAQGNAPRRRGFSLQTDETALQESLRYSQAEDAIVGFARDDGDIPLCRNLTGRPVSDIYALKEMLDSGKLHRASEATVVAIAPFDASNYTPNIVLISGTCKTETVRDQLSLLLLAIRAWNESPHGRDVYGNIWSVSTDGDPRRRRAIHHAFMKFVLAPTSPIYKELSSLHMLNLMCGEDDITHDGDFKHEEKRLATALRAYSGIFINGTHITPVVLKGHIRRLPGLTDSHIDFLFNNSDRQNVPNAHGLLKAIYDASRLPEIASVTANRPFVLLGEFLNSFFAPHTVPSMSLSQQVVNSSKCAFLLFAIYRQDCGRFLSNQLYYDIQASIKNAVFCIAKTKALDPTLPFYFIQLGDDRLEGQFGIYRTINHNSNPDLLQLNERAGAVQEVTDIFSRYPEADRQPYRLSLEGVSGIDHINPASWTGNVCVGDVNLRSSWEEGRNEAEKALRRAGIVPIFDSQFIGAALGGREIDLMRPFGRYIGVTEIEIDPDSLCPSGALLPIPDDLALDPDFTDDPDSGFPSPSNDDGNSSDDDVPLEELLDPPTMPAPEDDLGTVGETKSGVKRGWIDIDGSWVPLSTTVRVILGTHSKEKSTDRLRRVCSFSRYPSVDTQSDSILGDLCLIGQIILALVRVGRTIALAAVRVTAMHRGKERLECISTDHLAQSDVAMSGQILTLACENGVWYWQQTYVTLPGPNGAAAPSPLLVSFPACLVHLANPSLPEHNGSFVWAFKQHELVAVMDLLWAKSSEMRHLIPVCRDANEFPYTSQGTGERLVHQEASEEIERMPTERCGICSLCGRTVPIKYYMRTHIAKHIQAEQLGRPDPLRNGVASPVPCGFCGKTGGCTTTLKVNKKSTTMKSTCQYFDKFYYKTAENTTPTNPSTNRPIPCPWPACTSAGAVWSYGMRNHPLAAHGQDAFNRAVNEGLFQVSEREIENLRLDNMYLIPGRAPLVLSAPT
ncbi:hypothetical protein FRC09_005373 [Ceratobasidium sp. 395]|nr:hypothetical protein FRC09_005373 [Ceratobasidium sp. 395]